MRGGGGGVNGDAMPGVPGGGGSAFGGGKRGKGAAGGAESAGSGGGGGSSGGGGGGGGRAELGNGAGIVEAGVVFTALSRQAAPKGEPLCSKRLAQVPLSRVVVVRAGVVTLCAEGLIKLWARPTVAPPLPPPREDTTRDQTSEAFCAGDKVRGWVSARMCFVHNDPFWDLSRGNVSNKRLRLHHRPHEVAGSAGSLCVVVRLISLELSGWGADRTALASWTRHQAGVSRQEQPSQPHAHRRTPLVLPRRTQVQLGRQGYHTHLGKSVVAIS